MMSYMHGSQSISNGVSWRDGILPILTFISVVFFPWPLTALLAIVASVREPLMPLAAGLFVDTLYYAPQAGTWPVFTFYGLGVSVIVVLVRRQLRTGTIR